jgi:hypothetical protein
MISKVRGPEVGFTDLIDHCLNTEEHTFDMFPLRPSSAGKCTRAMAYELWEYLGKGSFPKEQKDPNVKRLLSLGSSVEFHSIRNFDLISKANRDFRITYKQQVMIAFRLKPADKDDSPPLVKGSLDFAIENRKEGWAIFADCKSAKDKFSSFMGSKWDETTEKLQTMESVTPISDTAFWAEDLEAFLKELNDPFFEDNFLQENVYCCTDFAKEVNCIAGLIYRYNKNDSRHIEVRFKPSETLAKRFEDKCNFVYKIAKTGTLEDIDALGCDFLPGHIKNAFCACHLYSGEGQDGARKDYFATFPPKKWPTDLGRLRNADTLDTFFETYSKCRKDASLGEQIEQDIIKLLMEEKCQKVKLPNGQVYEVKQFKTGGVGNGPRVALKRAKM